MSGDDKRLFLQTMEEMKNLRGEMCEFRGEMREFKESVKDRIAKLETHKTAGFARVFMVLSFCVSLTAVLITLFALWKK